MNLLEQILKREKLNIENLPSNVLKAIDKLDNTRLEYLAMETKLVKNTSLFESKFGGRPYWPQILSSPKNNDGEKLTFLAQINLS